MTRANDIYSEKHWYTVDLAKRLLEDLGVNVLKAPTRFGPDLISRDKRIAIECGDIGRWDKIVELLEGYDIVSWIPYCSPTTMLVFGGKFKQHFRELIRFKKVQIQLRELEIRKRKLETKIRRLKKKVRRMSISTNLRML
jgi:hypothetical protein